MIKKERLLILIIIILFVLFLIFSFVYFKPIKVTDNIFENTKIRLKLKRRFSYCIVESKIEDKNLSKELKNELKHDGFNKEKKYFVKKEKLRKHCGKLYKDYNNSKVVFKLKGKEKLIVPALSEYKDSGYILKGTKSKVIKKDNVDTSTLGSKVIIYKLKENLFSKYLIRKITVKDMEKPVIILKGKDIINIYIGDKFTDPGYEATDNFDGDITDKVKVEGSVDTKKEGKYTILYKVDDSSGNSFEIKRDIVVKQKPKEPEVSNVNGLTYIKGVLIVNKKYGLPKDYNPGVNNEAYNALVKMQSDAKALGLDLSLVSGFRSYSLQSTIYNNYVRERGEANANTFSAKPGYSEHQTGLAFDVGYTKVSFANTNSGIWLDKNCHLYGFIIRYPKGKTNITGYIYEPWHVRYLGVDLATKVKNSGLALEEYLGIN